MQHTTRGTHISVYDPYMRSSIVAVCTNSERGACVTEYDVIVKRVHNDAERACRAGREQWTRVSVFSVFVVQCGWRVLCVRINNNLVTWNVWIDGSLLCSLCGGSAGNDERRLMYIIAQFVTITQLRMLCMMSCTVSASSLFPVVSSMVRHKTHRMRSIVIQVAATAALLYTVELLVVEFELCKLLTIGDSGCEWLFPCSIPSLETYFADDLKN